MRVSPRVAFRTVCASLLTMALAFLSASHARVGAQEPPQPSMRWDGFFELITGRYDSPPPLPTPPQAANAPSAISRHAISRDGRYVVFSSEATNWSYSTRAIYRRDRRTGQSEVFLQPSMDVPLPVPSISGDGNHIAFQLCDPWMRPDSQPICDVWSLDVRGWRWTTLSTTPDGTFGDDTSEDPVLSYDGRYAVFVTKATNLSGSVGGVRQVVLRDRDADGNGIFDEPGTVTLETISARSPHNPGDGDSETAEVSDDGRFVAFRSRASNLVAGDNNRDWDVFLRDRLLGQTRRLNVRPEGQESYSPIDSAHISMSADGRYVAFTSDDGLLAPATIDDYNGVSDVFIYDRTERYLTRVDIGVPQVGGMFMVGEGPSSWPTLSADGRYVSLQSSAVNVAVPPVLATTHTYVVDRLEQRVTRISEKATGEELDHNASRPMLSGDGSVVMFWSKASTILGVPQDHEQLYAAVQLTLSPAEVVVPGAGGMGSFTVTAQQHTMWWAEWDWSQNWFNPDMPPYGIGPGSMAFYAYGANPDSTRRSATIRVGHTSVTFTQEVGLSVASVSPDSGPMSGGTTVTIRGTGFEPGMVVFAGAEVPAQFVDATTITFVTPAYGRPEVMPVAVRTADYRHAWLDNAFRYTDDTPPVIYPWSSGQTGEGGWFTGDVYVGWSVWDPESPITDSTCFSFVVSTDTAGTTYTCTAASDGGTSTGSITIKRDATGPAISVTTPRPLQLFELNSGATSDFTCADAFSGVTDCGLSAPSGGALDTQTPGWKTWWTDARDAAGNMSFTQIEYAVSNGVCAAPATGLGMWMRFDGDLTDVMSTNAAMNTGMPADTYVAGKSGQAYRFVSRGSGAIEHWHNGRLSFSSGMTVAMWIKPEAAKNGMLVKHPQQYRLERTAHGTINWMLMHPDTAPSFGTSYAQAPLNQWSHVVFTYNAGEVKVYVNGRLDRTWNWSGPTLAPASNPWGSLYIGGPDLGYGTPYVGGMDELQFFNRALGAAEIEQIFFAGASGVCEPAPTFLEVPSPINATYGAGTYPAVAILRDATGAPLAGKTIRLDQRAFDLAGETTAYTTMVTDANGMVRWDAPFDVVAGNYPQGFAAKFDGDLAHAHTGWIYADVVVAKAVAQVTWPAPAPITYGTALSYSTQLNATANVPGSFSYQPGNGSVPYAGTQTITARFWPSDTRNYEYTTTTRTIEVNKALPRMAIAGGTFTYNGQPRTASASATDYRGLVLSPPVTITYNGGPTPPVDAGVYTAVAHFAGDANHLPHSVSTSIAINKATPSIVFTSSMSATYDGQPHGATATVSGIGGTVIGVAAVTYNGSAALPVDVGTYTVSATFDGNANYVSRTVTSTLRITPATPSVTITGGPFTYDKQPHEAIVTVTGVGGALLAPPVTVTYNNLSERPVNAGSYAVAVSVAAAGNYGAASGTGTIVIDKATPQVSVPDATFTYGDLGIGASATVIGVDGEVLAPIAYTYNGAYTLPRNAGTYQVVATYAGSANYAPATGTATLTVRKAAPTFMVIGTTVTYDAKPHPGSVILVGKHNEALGPHTVSYNGQEDAPLNVGTYAVEARYDGSDNYEAAVATATITITKAAIALTVTGGMFTYTGLPQPATVTAAGVAGEAVPVSVSYDGLPDVPRVVGRYTATASFAGSLNYEPASKTASIVISPALLTVRAVDAVKRFGEPMPPFAATFSGFVNGETPADLPGTLTFSTTATQTSPVGTYAIVPRGFSTLNYVVTYINGALTIVKGAVSVAVLASPEPSGFDMPFTLTADVTASAPAIGAPGGSVSFYDGATLLGTAALASGRASITTAGLDAGQRAFEARYAGDTAFESGTGAATHTIHTASSTPVLSVVSSRNPSNAGQSVTFTATVSMAAGAVIGDVAFYDGATLLGSGTIVAGKVTWSSANLPAGSHAITAKFLGSPGVPSSTSPILVQAVGLAGWKDRVTTTTLSSSVNPMTLGDTVTVTATVTGSSSTAPEGRVLFMVNGVVIGDPAGVELTAATGTTASATLTVPGLMHGRHRLTATYLGSSVYRGSTGALTQTIN